MFTTKKIKTEKILVLIELKMSDCLLKLKQKTLGYCISLFKRLQTFEPRENLLLLNINKIFKTLI